MGQGSIRIIGGKWRGKRLQVPTMADVRPTPDRVRETVFNWLMPYLPGARCLDLFAGSGALGLEALSRGAAYVELIDNKPAIVTLLQAQLAHFDDAAVHVYCKTVPKELVKPEKPFDIIFIDPPYQAKIGEAVYRYLEEQDFLASPAYIYIEAADKLTQAGLPSNWHILKALRAGQVAYHLIKREKDK